MATNSHPPALAMTELRIRETADNPPPGPPRANLPLPRELRDQIWGYLLHSDHTKESPYHTREQATQSELSKRTRRTMSLAHTFRYHTNILGTNRQVCTETTQILSSNHFVVVSARWLYLQQAKHAHDLPIVCEEASAVAKFKHHHLRIHIQHGVKSLRGPDMSPFMILAADLPNFCGALMQWEFLMTATSATILVNPPHRDDPEHMNPDAFNAKLVPQTKIQFLSTEAKSVAHGLQRKLLAPFADMIVGGQKVTVINSLLSQQHIDSLRIRMGPGFVSIAPVLWKVVELARNIKQVADALVVKGDYHGALVKYSLVPHAAQRCFISLLPPTIHGRESAIPMALLHRLILDSGSTAAFVCFREGDMAQATAAMQDTMGTDDRMMQLPLQDPLLPGFGRSLACVHGLYWAKKLCMFVGRNPGPRERDDVPEIIVDLEDMCEDMEGCSYLPALQHDIEFMEHCDLDRPSWYENRDGKGASNDDLLANLSVRRCDPQIFDTPAPEGWDKPAWSEGFLQPSHREYLSANGLL